MKKHNLIVVLLGIGLASSSVTALADGWTFLPVRDANYKADMTLSIADGSMKPEHADSGNYVGAELAFNCLLMTPPSGIIRSKISYGEYNHNGLKLSIVEINPRWTTGVAENLTFGIGPGIGLVRAEVAGQTTSMAALQLGADLDYRIGSFNLGLGARWQDTSNKDIAPNIKGANNTLIQAKVGIIF